MLFPFVKGAGYGTFYVATLIPAHISFSHFQYGARPSGGVEYTVNVWATIHEIDGKDVFFGSVLLLLCVFSPSSYELKSTFLHLFAWTFCFGANTGSTTVTPGTLLFKKEKFIFVFLYLNICYLNNMLVCRLMVHQQQKYLYYYRVDIQLETGLHQWRFYMRNVVWSHSISNRLDVF